MLLLYKSLSIMNRFSLRSFCCVFPLKSCILSNSNFHNIFTHEEGQKVAELWSTVVFIIYSFENNYAVSLEKNVMHKKYKCGEYITKYNCPTALRNHYEAKHNHLFKKNIKCRCGFFLE